MNNKALKINYVAVIATGFAAFVLSLIWYSPLLFGKIWTEHRNSIPQSAPGWTMFFAPLRELIVSYVIAILIIRLNIINWKDAIKLSFLLWLAFQAVGMAGAIIWDNMPLKLGSVHAGDWLVKMLFMAASLTIWHNRKTQSVS